MDREQAETVRALSGLECFDKRVFSAVTKALNIGLPVTLFDEFCSASYAELLPSSSRLAKIHDIVRSYLRPSIRSDDLLRIVLAVISEAQASKSEGYYPRVSWLLRSLLPVLTLPSLNIGTGTWSEIVVLCLDMADAGYVDEAIVIGDGLGLTSNPSDISILGDVIRAHCLRRTGRLKEARMIYASIKDEMLIDSLRELRLRVRYHAAHVDHLLGDYASSKKVYEAIVATHEQYPADQEARYLAKRQLGDLSMLEGRFSEALHIFNECASLRQSDRLWHLECSRFIGHVYRFNWMLPEAEKHYVEIAEQSKAYGLRGMYGKALANLTETYWWTNPSKALEVGRDAVEANEVCGNLIEVGKALTAMALAELNLGHVNKAIEYLERAQETQKTAGYRAGLIFVEGARAYCWFATGKDDDVSECLDRAAQDTDSLGVYKYLNWFYRAVCATKDISSDACPYDWIDKSRLSDGIRSLSARLSQLRSNH